MPHFSPPPPLVPHNPRATTLLLLLSCTLVSCLEWIGNGRSITCIQVLHVHVEVSHILSARKDLMTPGTSLLTSSTPTATSCRIMPQSGLGDYCHNYRSTFTLPKQLSGGVLGDTVAGPGVGAYNPR